MEDRRMSMVRKNRRRMRRRRKKRKRRNDKNCPVWIKVCDRRQTG
jgi:hypothetical protein